MKRVPFVALQGSLLALAITCLPISSGEPAKKVDSADSVKAIKQVVTSFYDNLSQGKAEGNKTLFLNQEVTVVGIPGGEGVDKVWQKKASEVLKSWQDAGGAALTVDSTQVELLDDALAVARVKLHNDLVKVRAVFTLTSEGGNWRIASYVFETRLP